jgi:hypothetical protein
MDSDDEAHVVTEPEISIGSAFDGSLSINFKHIESQQEKLLKDLFPPNYLTSLKNGTNPELKNYLKYYLANLIKLYNTKIDKYSKLVSKTEKLTEDTETEVMQIYYKIYNEEFAKRILQQAGNTNDEAVTLSATQDRIELIKKEQFPRYNSIVAAVGRLQKLHFKCERKKNEFVAIQHFLFPRSGGKKTKKYRGGSKLIEQNKKYLEIYERMKEQNINSHAEFVKYIHDNSGLMFSQDPDAKKKTEKLIRESDDFFFTKADLERQLLDPGVYSKSRAEALLKGEDPSKAKKKTEKDSDVQPRETHSRAARDVGIQRTQQQLRLETVAQQLDDEESAAIQATRQRQSATTGTPPQQERNPYDLRDAQVHRDEGERLLGDLCTKLNDCVETIAELKTEARSNLRNFLAGLILSIGTTFDYTSKETYLNMAIMGDAGLGKTKAAQVIGKIYGKSGLLCNENYEVDIVTPKDFKGSYIGETGPKTYALMTQNLERVLFCDEAYGFVDCQRKPDGTAEITKSSANVYGYEAINEILVLLDQFQGMSLMIIAGYEPSIMGCFFEMNTGLRRRFPNMITLNLYSAEQLFNMYKEIFFKPIHDYDHNIEIQDRMKSFIMSAENFKDTRGLFPNQVGDVQNLFSFYEKNLKLAKAHAVKNSMNFDHVLFDAAEKAAIEEFQHTKDTKFSKKSPKTKRHRLGSPHYEEKSRKRRKHKQHVPSSEASSESFQFKSGE